ncbi:MAG: hypothetical protein ACRED0_01840 [Gammaproteobacteria bacterium]
MNPSRGRSVCAFFQSVDRAVLESGVADAEAQRIKDFPYLRVDRFLASYRYQLSAEGFIFWVDLTRELEWWARVADGDPQPRRDAAMGPSCHRFVGHRHIDDPDLVERYFVPADRWSPH